MKFTFVDVYFLDSTQCSNAKSSNRLINTRFNDAIYVD
jgi:hypothetical protein